MTCQSFAGNETTLPQSVQVARGSFQFALEQITPSIIRAVKYEQASSDTARVYDTGEGDTNETQDKPDTKV